MLNTNVQDRQTGKTTKVIKLMDADTEAILIIPAIHMKELYPVRLWDRIVSGKSVLNGKLRGKYFSKVILDEGFLYNREELAHLYYYLGSNHIETVSYGTI